MKTLKLNNKEKGCFGLFFLIIILFAIIAAIPMEGRSQVRENQALSQVHILGIALWQFSVDHGNTFPEGKSSTEISQKLIDGHYITDPTLFYYPLPGKVKADGAILKPKNVSWDVTCCLDATSPDDLPMVFLTGYKVVYQAGAKAVLIRIEAPPTWFDWWNNTPKPIRFTAACYRGNTATVLQHPDPDGSFPDFIGADFDPKGKVYRQLTPEGELPP